MSQPAATIEHDFNAGLAPDLSARLDSLKQRAAAAIDGQREALLALSHRIHDTPELSFQETQASAWLADYLASRGFAVQRGAYELPTAFDARWAGAAGPTIAFCAEYDALPGVGHGCGHNVIATAGAGAGIGLAEVLGETGGSVRVLGTPAEEAGGGKIIMADRGALNGVDVAMMVHPSPIEAVGFDVIAMVELEVEFFGRAAHAAASPEQGINALDALITAYNAISQLRQHIAGNARIHGIITDGGQAPNIVPEHAAARYYVRAATERALAPLQERVLNCFRAGAQATGARLEYRWLSHPYSELWTNPVLASSYLANARALGRDPRTPDRLPSRAAGSTDMGNISKRVPAIHPMVGITDGVLIPGHSIEMAAAAATEHGDQAVLDSAKALAFTAIDVLVRPGMLDDVRAAFVAQSAADADAASAATS